MEIIYSGDVLPSVTRKVLFLAGPEGLPNDRTMWRDEAVALLRARAFDGTVIVPDSKPGRPLSQESDRAAWVNEALAISDVLLVWLPASADPSEALEAGTLISRASHRGRTALGVSEQASWAMSARALAQRESVLCWTTLPDALDAALGLFGESRSRQGIARKVPLQVFSTSSFEGWYRAQQGAGNVLHDVDVEWLFWAGPEKVLLFWALRVDLLVSSEKRHKQNEVIIGRPDDSAILLYHKDAQDFKHSQIVIIREFRSPARSTDGFARGLPGGSKSESNLSAIDVAVAELREETGLSLGRERLRKVSARQPVATVSIHQTNLFAAEISMEELQKLRRKAGKRFGVDREERTAIEVWTLADLLLSPDLDWTTLGMVFAALEDPRP